jgi:hypothetical protein
MLALQQEKSCLHGKRSRRERCRHARSQALNVPTAT